MPDNVTANRSYQLPDPANDLDYDIYRLIAALAAIDIDVAGLLVSVAQRALIGHGHVIADTTGLQSAIDAKQDLAGKGSANGYAELDSTGKVPSAQLPAALFGALSYQGTWNANTNTPTIPASSSANKGYYYKVATLGATAIDGINDWKVGDWIVSNGTVWDKVDNTDLVSSVAGLVGTITAVALKAALAITVADITNASANGRSLISAANYAAMLSLLGLTSAAKLDVENQALTGGATVTVKDLGTLSGTTKTLDVGDRPIQKITNNGPGTIAPGATVGCCYVEVINAAGAGVVVTSAFTKVEGEFDVLAASKFLCGVTVTANMSVLQILKVA